MPLRATEYEEAIGMDGVFRGEEAYVRGEGAILIKTEVTADKEAAPIGSWGDIAATGRAPRHGGRRGAC